MPLSAAELSKLQTLAQADVTAVQAVADAVNALVVDPTVNPLQTQLDAANATIASLTSDKAALVAHLATLGADVDAIVAAAAKAKADE